MSPPLRANKNLCQNVANNIHNLLAVERHQLLLLPPGPPLWVLESTMDELEDHWWDFQRHLELKKECLEWSLGEQGMGATSPERHHQVALITLLERPY
ncbi:hypothetical protein YC2023_082660 [Brassica napus]